ncbi:MAG: ComF family protein [Proteobacteria bacterium]|nr:ComF family protein [Pseudomonadota bacterium]
MVAERAELAKIMTGGARWLLDAVLPPRCPGCGIIVDIPAAVCGGCWSRIAFITAPMCQCCGTPFEFTVAERSLCGRCLAEPPVYGRARSATLYDDASRGVLLRFKHGDGLHLTGLLGAWLARAGAPLLADADLLVPVPLHWTRLFARRYNQAAALALDLGARTDTLVDVLSLTRVRRTPSQGTRTRSGRERNVRGAFQVLPDRANLIRGKRVLLVDDVLTSGATVSACTRVLLRAGAAGVDILTIARVP